eukprot:CAMPEP_0176179436 /NCGR_PEP_ID=MMETSP0120_2-20121206/91937_1 /TAXON_ID=160619 /ORGANISM="Kryptoperidinium foliaceum, Strain CCMP 1326" /LENGTH=102 /DNA_ID=CAMNT_0017517607 /DNA_START=33 /DNA_END=341 /DNA_ORIENTATION=-
MPMERTVDSSATEEAAKGRVTVYVFVLSFTCFCFSAILASSVSGSSRTAFAMESRAALVTLLKASPIDSPFWLNSELEEEDDTRRCTSLTARRLETMLWFKV